MPSIKPFPSQIGLQYWFMTTGIKFAQQISLGWNRYMYNHAFNITKGVYELLSEQIQFKYRKPSKVFCLTKF